MFILLLGRQSRNFQFHGKISNHHIPHDVSAGSEHGKRITKIK
jgi:hypothetical protein